MATGKNLCCVCGKNTVCECSFFPRCEEKSCTAIYHLCFSGVADGLCAARNSSREDLEFAFQYLMAAPHKQKTLLKGITREIARRIKQPKNL